MERPSPHPPGPAAGASADPPTPLVIPVVEERASVTKRRVETGRVRIVKKVSTRRETLEADGWDETLDIERVPIGQPVDGPVAARQEGDTLVIPVLEERLVIEKRLFLKEELRVTKRRTPRPRTQETLLRREEISVERLPPVAEDDPTQA
ncbi:conserved domain-containing protein [Methylomagnum ishizawai]|uniref:Conserved domain-containing protein n=1 Tax=Methylomagnum ishizawai TaxID=1760988 RepID=A0A1Y6DAW8_9GAMM|nr:YsnF/AvaK domain-containing protein [Methylomagnum ishizawai]SMF97763.1 conserved domain-containing protein [Methylomagnum ishizawai]